MQETAEEKFRELFGETREYQSEYDDEPCGLINPEKSVILLYEDTEKFGNVPMSQLSESPDSFNYSIETDEASLWDMRGRDSVYYYNDEYIHKIATLFGVTPAGLYEYVYSCFDYSDFPAKFQKDGVRILVAPYTLSA